MGGGWITWGVGIVADGSDGGGETGTRMILTYRISGRNRPVSGSTGSGSACFKAMWGMFGS